MTGSESHSTRYKSSKHELMEDGDRLSWGWPAKQHDSGGKRIQEAYGRIMIRQIQLRKVATMLLQWVVTNIDKTTVPVAVPKLKKITAYKWDSNIYQQDWAEINEITKDNNKTTVSWDVTLFGLVQAYQQHLCLRIFHSEEVGRLEHFHSQQTITLFRSYLITSSVNRWANPPHSDYFCLIILIRRTNTALNISNILQKTVILYNGLWQRFSSRVPWQLSIGTLISVHSALLSLQLGKIPIFVTNWQLN